MTTSTATATTIPPGAQATTNRRRFNLKSSSGFPDSLDEEEGRRTNLATLPAKLACHQKLSVKNK
jgi:hypothetical protein